MSKIASILACCVAASMFSFGALALPGSPAPAKMAAFDVTLVRNFCGPGLHRGPDGGCIPDRVPYGYAEAPIFGVPYVAPPAFGLPYVAAPVVGLPYVAPPVVGLPYIGRREYVAPRACPYGYVYLSASGHCVAI
jgi:hypothetical protein